MHHPPPEPITLDDILITETLSQRSPRSPDWQAEAQAMQSLAQQISKDPEAVLQTLANIALTLCRAGTAGVSLLETTPEGTESFRWVAMAGQLANAVGSSTPRNVSLCGICLDRCTPQLFSYPERYFADFQDLQDADTPIVEGLVLPLVCEHHALGIVWIASHDEQRRFNTEDVRLMTNLANFTAAAFHLNQGKAQVQQSGQAPLVEVAVRDCQQAKVQLLISEERLRLASEAAHFGIYEYIPQTHQLSWSPLLKAIHGLPAEAEIIPEQLHEFVHPEDRAQFLNSMAQLLRPDAPDGYEHEFRIIRTDGEVRWLLDKGRIFFSGAGEHRRVERIIGVTSDISERKRIETALRESEAHLQRTTEAAQVGTWQWNLKTNEVIWSQQMKKLLGQTAIPGPKTHSDWLALLHQEDLRRMEAGLDGWLQGGQEIDFDYRIILPDTHETRWISSLGRVEYDAQGNPVMLQGIALDITDRKQAEVSLYESEAKYRSLFESIDEGFAIMEVMFNEGGKPVNLRYLETNRVFEQQTGLSDVVGKTVHDVVPSLEPLSVETLAEVARTGESVRFEDYVQGTDRWFSVYVSKVGGESSHQVAMVFDNITDRKRREADLAFLAQIAEDSSRLASEEAIMQSIGERLATHLRLDGFTFADVDEGCESVTIKYGWNAADVPQFVGTFRLAEYMTGEFARTMRAGETWVVCDTQHDERTDAKATAAICAGAIINVPYHRRGEWQGCLTVTCREMRQWTADEIALIVEVSNRTFPRLERARAEEDLRSSEEKYRSLFTSIDEGYFLAEVIFDENDKPIDILYLEANPAAICLAGRDFSGQRMREIDPHYEDYWYEIYGGVALTGESVRAEHYAEPHGRWFDFYAFKVGRQESRHVAAVFRDVTDRKKAEAALQESEERQAYLLRLSDALRPLSDPIKIQWQALNIVGEYLDLDRVLYNEIDPDVTTYTVHVNYVREGFPSYVGSYPMRPFAESVKNLRLGKTYVIYDAENEEQFSEEERAICRGINVQAFVVVPLIKQGQWVVNVVAHYSKARNWTQYDISILEETAERTWAAVERACAEAALRESEIRRIQEQAAREEERQRAESLAELDRAKTLFFSNISHEFRTPLTLILGPLAEALATLDEDNETEHPLSIHLREQLQIAHRNGLRLLKLVNTLLDFSRIEADRLQAHYEPTDLSTYTAELASVFRSTIESAGLQLMINCPPLPEPIYIDREMWEKIILNLLSNAFKFTFAGSILVSLKYQTNQVELTISDTGTGIPAQDLPHLFERFYQVKGAQGRSYEGSGIGLALVQELVQRLGGSITVTSELNQGTSFRITLPTGQAHLPTVDNRLSSPQSFTTNGIENYIAEAARWLPETEVNPPNLDLELKEGVLQSGSFAAECLHPLLTNTEQSPAKVLIVDDNADMRNYLSRLLHQQYQIEAVNDGLAALNSITQQQPDLILSDVMMPRMDGLQLLQSLRKNDQTKEIPIILLSARAGEDAQVEGLAAGADDYLTKPFSAQELLARVNANLQLTRMRREVATQAQMMRDIQILNDRLEQRVTERTTQLQALNQELEAFAYSVSHDLRTPLRYISSFTEQLRDQLTEPLSATASPLPTLNIILRSALSAEQMVDDLLAFSRASQSEMHRTLVPLDILVQQVQDQLQTETVGREIQWKIAPLPTVNGDPTLLQLVLQNLLSNAVKYTRDRNPAEISINSWETDTEYVVVVKDNGAGFDMKYSDRLFQLFQRLHTQKAFTGTGVGLANVRRIIHRHGGRTWAEGAVNQGATFYFSLPK
jgi:PAS domain S-box-containing protein